MVAGLIIVPIVSLLTPGMEPAHVDKIFACYDDLVEATSRKVLPDDRSFDSPAFQKKKKKR